MPYVPQEKRESLDKYYEKLKKVVKTNEDLTNLLLCVSGTIRLPEDNPIQVLSDHMTLVAYPDGGLNYILFKYALFDIDPSYNNYKNFIGAILKASDSSEFEAYKYEYREAAEWIRLMLLVKYELKKRRENGDVI